MKQPVKILFAVAEASPIAKVGGLADVAGSLPRMLRKAGHDARIIMPQYSFINLEGYHPVVRGDFVISSPGKQESIGITEVALKDGTPVYLLENDRYFGRPVVYGEWDDLDRFLLFSEAVMEAPKKLNWQPDILHSHDWHTGTISPLLKVACKNDPFYSKCASVYTIHNLGYQGWFDDSFAARTGLHYYMAPPEDPLRNTTYKMAGLAIYYSDVITTVSETYAEEIQTPEYGRGLEPLLQRRKDSLFGILNGIDYDEFNPATDPKIAANYDAYNLDKRSENKLALQERAGLRVDLGIPLLGMAGRVVEQKGIDITVEALSKLFAETDDIQFVLQGLGEQRYHDLLSSLESRYPDKSRMFLKLDFDLAQFIYAGCDIFLTPSRFEPCGLTPMIAMHFGAIPVVRRTGGMTENVPDCSPDLSNGRGFVFQNYDGNDLLAAIKRALTAFQKKEAWRKLMARDMLTDLSWKPSIPKYEAVYEMALRKVRG